MILLSFKKRKNLYIILTGYQLIHINIYFKDPIRRRPKVINFSDVFHTLRFLFRTLRLFISSCENIKETFDEIRHFLQK